MSDTLPLYPLKFAPLYCARMWGGTMMTEFLHRDVPVSETPIGEAWEIVDRPEAASSVVNGALTGWTLRRLMETCGPAITGKPVPDNRFPLIVKLIDAAQRLSLQVHPDAATATALGNGAEAKAEMWYLLAHRPGARIFAGLSRRATRQRMRELLRRMLGGEATLTERFSEYRLELSAQAGHFSVPSLLQVKRTLRAAVPAHLAVDLQVAAEVPTRDACRRVQLPGLMLDITTEEELT